VSAVPHPIERIVFVALNPTALGWLPAFIANRFQYFLFSRSPESDLLTSMAG
jgi:hypothetical protein